MHAGREPVVALSAFDPGPRSAVPMVGRNARLRLRFQPSAACLGALASRVRFSRLEVSEQSSRLKILVRMARRGALMHPCVQRCSIGGLYAHANGGAFPRGDAPACCVPAIRNSPGKNRHSLYVQLHLHNPYSASSSVPRSLRACTLLLRSSRGIDGTAEGCPD